MTSSRILVVDDEDRFRRALVRSLKGHAYEVRESATGNAAIEEARAFGPHVVLLDLMLPDVDGLTVCHEIRSQTDAAIIVLSVLGDDRTKVRALDEGADDYLTKPFSSNELLARIRAALRRAGLHLEAPSYFEADSLRIDFDSHTVLLDGRELRLTPNEFAVLRLLALSPGKLLRHEAFLREIWGSEAEGDVQSLRTYIKQLRSKLGDSSTHPRFIRTDPGLGYRFIQPDS